MVLVYSDNKNLTIEMMAIATEIAKQKKVQKPRQVGVPFDRT